MMNKNSKYLLITTFFSFLFCSGCLTDNLGDCYRHIGLENWLAKHIDVQEAKNFFQELRSNRSKLIDAYLEDKEITVEQIKNDQDAMRRNLKLFESVTNPRIAANLMVAESESQGEKVIRLSEHSKQRLVTFENDVRPYLKNPNQSEEEISHLRFQWVCEYTVYDCEMYEEILKAKQEQEGIN